MRVKLQLVICSDDGREETVTDLVTLKKNHQRIEHLGLTLAEAKQLLTTIQQRVLQQQVDAFLDTCSTCPDCGAPLKVKAYQASPKNRRNNGTCCIISLMESPGLCNVGHDRSLWQTPERLRSRSIIIQRGARRSAYPGR
jgi:hypothetical protein